MNLVIKISLRWESIVLIKTTCYYFYTPSQWYSYMWVTPLHKRTDLFSNIISLSKQVLRLVGCNAQNQVDQVIECKPTNYTPIISKKIKFSNKFLKMKKIVFHLPFGKRWNWFQFHLACSRLYHISKKCKLIKFIVTMKTQLIIQNKLIWADSLNKKGSHQLLAWLF